MTATRTPELMNDYLLANNRLLIAARAAMIGDLPMTAEQINEQIGAIAHVRWCAKVANAAGQLPGEHRARAELDLGKMEERLHEQLVDLLRKGAHRG